MVKTFTYKKNTQYANPDEIKINELHLFLNFRDYDAVVFSFVNDALYIGERTIIHPMLYQDNKINDYCFDGRLWYDRKYFTFWFNKWDDSKEIFTDICKMQNLLKNKSYVVNTHRTRNKINSILYSINIDISKYNFLFLIEDKGDTKIMLCDYDFIQKQAQNTTIILSSTNFHRFFIKLKKTKKEIKKIKYSVYKEDCEYWKNKIGNMDVAEYHLLKYEE